MKKFAAILLCMLMIAGSLTVLSSCKKDESKSVVKIGLIAPLTGGVAVYGTSVEKGVKMAVEEINASDSLLKGITIELVEKDSLGDPTTATNAFNALSDDGVKAIVGPVVTGTTTAVTSLANENQVVMVTPSATGDSVTTSSDYVFRSCFKDSFQGIMAARYAKSLNISQVGVLYAVNSDYSKGLYEAFRDECQRLGITLKTTMTSPSIDSETTFATQLNTIKEQLGADGFLFAPYYYEAVGTLIVPEARAAGFNGIIMGADGYDGVLDYVKSDRLSAYTNVYFTNHYSSESTSEKIVNFISGYKAKFNEDPTAFSALGYDAMYMLAKAVDEALGEDRDATKLTGAAIKAKLDNSSINGVTGNFSLDETGTPVKDVVIMKYELDSTANTLKAKYVTTLTAN